LLWPSWRDSVLALCVVAWLRRAPPDVPVPEPVEVGAVLGADGSGR